MTDLKAQSLYRALRRQPWLYDRRHDSMRPQVRRIVHGMLRGATRMAAMSSLFGRSFGHAERLHLGSGRNPLPGWVNVDINPFSGAQLWLDLRDQWPIRNEAVAVVYARHCFEHFSERDLRRILRQCARVLRPGGALRIGVPSLEVAVQQYLRRDFSFADWLDQEGPTAKKFVAYITDNGNHPIVLDFEYLHRLLSDAGFVDIDRRPGGDSGFLPASALAPKDCAEDWTTLYVEAVKPARISDAG